MNPEQWERIAEIFPKALSLHGEERESFLSEACANEGELRKEVDSLLASHDEAGSHFLNEPDAAFEQVSGRLRWSEVQAGRRIGPYLVAEQIGRGGMGEVFAATRADGQFEKKVALKLVRGGCDTSFVLERFRNERQILAGLDHPNIARLLDGGTTDDGIPYLVMELVEGAPIDEYCDAHKLSITQRLVLFRQVCAAVAYAHQRLVIHRDLKPSNILVAQDGVPKLLDFGIAKILGASGSTDTTALRPMTPEYASPEQVRGDPISTSTDVYSLGVVLYLLLTGRSPYRIDTPTPERLAQVITQEEPERPSTSVQRTKADLALRESRENTPEAVSETREVSPLRLQKRLRGDLDFILLKALRKEPAQRYSSVEQFSEDIHRHLEEVPVAARKGTWAYKGGKFLRRYKAGVLAGALVFATLLIAMFVVLRESRVADANRRRAEARFDDVRKLANSLIFEIHDSIRDLPGSVPARRLIVERALEYLDGLGRDAHGEPSLQRELAIAYERLGDVQGNPDYANLGDTAGALQNYHKALRIHEALNDAGQGLSAEEAGGMSRLYDKVGATLAATGDFQGALASSKQAVRLADQFASRSAPNDVDWRAGSYFFLAGILRTTGDLRGAADSYEKAISIREFGLKSFPSDPDLRTHLAGDYSYLSHVLLLQGDLNGALEKNAEAITLLRALCAADLTNATVQEFLAQTYFYRGLILDKTTKRNEALRNYLLAQTMLADLSEHDANNVLTQQYLGFSYIHIGTIQVRQGSPKTGLTNLERALSIFEILSADKKNRYILSGLADAYEGIGQANEAVAHAPHASPNEQAASWGAACSFYQKSRAIWLDMRERSALAAEDAQKLAGLSREIASCNARVSSTRGNQ